MDDHGRYDIMEENEAFQLLSYDAYYDDRQYKHDEELFKALTGRTCNTRLHILPHDTGLPVSMAYPTCHDRIFVVAHGKVCDARPFAAAF